MAEEEGFSGSTVNDSVDNSDIKLLNNTNNESNDKELDVLLDSALEDFGKQPKPKQDSSVDYSSKTESNAASESEQVNEQLLSDLFDGDSSSDASKQFDSAMKTLMGGDPVMLDHISKLTEAAQTAGDTPEGQKEFSETLAQTLGSLAQNAEELQGELSEEDLMKAMGGLGLDGAGGGDLDFLPMMQGMMQNLLSKDVLYPSLKEISDKYPDWLDKNKAKLDKNDFDRYQKQYDILCSICNEFETEVPTDTADVKKEKFEKIVDQMQKMQDCGQVPPEIVGEMAPGLEFDSEGNPKLPGSPEQCAIS